VKPLAGKRLLHLGGALFQTPSLERARSLGCEVILADHDPDAPGRAHADVFEQVSTRDVEGVFALAIAHAADGIMTYASDSSVETAAVVAQRLGLPGNPPEAAATIRNKDLFRRFQTEHGLPRPEFFVAATAAEAFSRVRDLRFPLVVKPVDSAGRRDSRSFTGSRRSAVRLRWRSNSRR
jgi:biotin carboxylase